MYSPVDELDLEDEGGVGGDVAHGAGAVRIVGRAGDLSLLSLLELADTLVPSLDDLTLTKGELERLATVVARVEDGAVKESTSVVDLDLVTLLWLGITLAFAQWLDLEFVLGGGSGSGLLVGLTSTEAEVEATEHVAHHVAGLSNAANVVLESGESSGEAFEAAHSRLEVGLLGHGWHLDVLILLLGHLPGGLLLTPASGLLLLTPAASLLRHFPGGLLLRDLPARFLLAPASLVASLVVLAERLGVAAVALALVLAEAILVVLARHFELVLALSELGTLSHLFAGLLGVATVASALVFTKAVLVLLLLHFWHLRALLHLRTLTHLILSLLGVVAKAT